MHNDFDLTIAQIIKKYGLLTDKKHSKKLGQNFLCDSSLLAKIAKQALPLNDEDIIEIGPGPGGLTREIIKMASPSTTVYCIEKDRELEEVHKNIFEHTNANIRFIYEDALKIKPQDLTGNNIAIIANLPYNVGTRLLLNWLSDLSRISKLVLMFQKEVAERICAKAGTKAYGRLSVVTQLLCNYEKCFDVSKAAFTPAPKVDSTVIKLTPKKDRPKNIDVLENLTSICFQQRRKTIMSILKKKYPKNIEKALEICNIRQSSRPEEISPEQFLQLSTAIHEPKF